MRELTAELARDALVTLVCELDDVESHERTLLLAAARIVLSSECELDERDEIILAASRNILRKRLRSYNPGLDNEPPSV